MSLNTLFCDGWEFSKNPINTEYEQAVDWKRVDIPHDWLIYQVNDLYETSTGWYRRTLNYSPKAGIRTALRFEGVYMNSRVYVNGALAGEWKYGYSTFEFDVTDLLKDGDNLIAVRVDYLAPNSRWYSGAGIYRRVWLKEYPDIHLASDGIYISADISGKVTVSTEALRPENITAEGLSVRCTVFDGERNIVSAENPCCAVDKSTVPNAIVQKGCRYSANIFSLIVPNPVLWDTEAPHLYKCVVELIRNGEVIDSDESMFGIRKAEFTPDKGFFLNGRHLKIHGACQHHDLGALGAAVNRNAIRRQLEKLREIGVNAVRTTHNMPAVELMEEADKMGFLIMSEGFDMWELHKTENDYAGFFPEWVEKDVASWVRRDRNHPSLIGWSLGNEIYDTHVSERGQEVTSMLQRLVRLHDPRANGIVTVGSNYMQWENAQKCADLLKIAGYNYAERLYDDQHKKHPDWCIYGSETSSVLQSRGVYHFPLSEMILTDVDEQCSALGNTTTGWAARNTEACIIPDRDAEYCAGQFIWTGFDYIGEPTPYTTKNSYFGQIDTAGFCKDSAYLFRAEWTDFEKSPFVHIYPYWDFAENQRIDVRVTSNAPLIRLFKDGNQIAEKHIDHKHGKELTLNTVIEYSKGCLTAVAYDENGNEAARDTVCSFGDTAEIRLTPENTQFKANGTDLAFIDIDAYDFDGNFVANANNRVFVEVSGAGRLIGLDNGDSTDYDEYKGTSRRLFSGKLLAIIAASDKAGEVEIKVSSKGLPDAHITLTALPSEVPAGVSCIESNKPARSECPDDVNDVPVRRINLSAESCVFTPDQKEITVNVKALPENASYSDFEYKLTNIRNADTKLAEIAGSADGTVTVRCKGDGEFCLRAMCKNGTEKYHVVSTLFLKGEGIGAAFVDPYKHVAGGSFTLHNGNVTPALENGAAFAGGVNGTSSRIDTSRIGFENVDFGDIGSDTVTVPLFVNGDNQVNIRFYDGDPENGGELIGDFTYQGQCEWHKYAPQTYKLSKTLCGVHTFVIESDYSYEISGFEFKRPIKERAELYAVNADSIFGDKFTKNSEDVTGIGNNVMLYFGDFDFTEFPPSKIVISGRSKLPINSIHVIFGADKDGELPEERVLAEFEGADKYTEREFPINGIGGKRTVSFAFLPGSDFDFKLFRFE